MEIQTKKIFIFHEMQRFGFRCDFSIFTFKSSHDWCLCLVHLFAFSTGAYTSLLVKKNYYEKFLLATKKVLMKTIVLKDPANSDLSVLRVRPIFLLVNALDIH